MRVVMAWSRVLVFYALIVAAGCHAREASERDDASAPGIGQPAPESASPNAAGSDSAAGEATPNGGPPAVREQVEMQVVSAPDGTPIAVFRSGSGPPLVLVHGTTADHTRWAPVLTALEAHFTIYSVERRGRGQSGDAPSYTLEREAEDVAAVIEAAGEPVFLFGHSYGALCALEASLLTGAIDRMVLYEPPIPVGIPIFPEGAVERLQALLDEGQSEQVLTTFFSEVVRMPPTEIEALQAQPNWQARVAAAHTIPREMTGVEGYVFRPERFAGLQIPVLLLRGENSPAFLRAATQSVGAALPSSRIDELPGQQHIAMNTAPVLFVSEVVGFLTQSDTHRKRSAPWLD